MIERSRLGGDRFATKFGGLRVEISGFQRPILSEIQHGANRSGLDFFHDKAAPAVREVPVQQCQPMWLQFLAFYTFELRLELDGLTLCLSSYCLQNVDANLRGHGCFWVNLGVHKGRMTLFYPFAVRPTIGTIPVHALRNSLSQSRARNAMAIPGFYEDDDDDNPILAAAIIGLVADAMGSVPSIRHGGGFRR